MRFARPPSHPWEVWGIIYLDLKSEMSATVPLPKSCMHAVNLGTASIHKLCDESMRDRHASIEIVNDASNEYCLSRLLLEVLESPEASISTHNPQFIHKLHHDQWWDIIWKASFGRKFVFRACLDTKLPVFRACLDTKLPVGRASQVLLRVRLFSICLNESAWQM